MHFSYSEKTEISRRCVTKSGREINLKVRSNKVKLELEKVLNQL